MSSEIAPWQRLDRRATGRIADAMFVVFHAGELAPKPSLDAAQFGAPSSAALSLVEVSEIDDRAWLDGWRAGAIRQLAQTTHDDRFLATLDGADRCHLVRVTVADPADHVHLQAAWAYVRWLCARGATNILDVFALRWHAAESLLNESPSASFDVEREVSVVTDPPPPGKLWRMIHTRGLGKLARPDVVAVATDDEVDDTLAAVRLLASRLADGYLPERPGELLLDSHPWGRVLLAAATAGQLPQTLGLQNDALLVSRG